MGQHEIWRSLRTGDPKVAKRRFHRVVAEIESSFEQARAIAGLTTDPAISPPSEDDLRSDLLFQAIKKAISEEISTTSPGRKDELIAASVTFRDAYARYMMDPTRAWSRRTRIAHEATRALALSIMGADMPIEQITRGHCRDFIEVLQRIPANARKRFPTLTPREAADQEGPSCAPQDRMSIANINAYLNKLGSFFNWATLEELIVRNPARGMRLIDGVHKRDKRRPFSMRQLRAIFDAPIYRGCVNDGHGYAKAGSMRPKGTRYWVPLLGLYTGMRLNEVCQLDCSDIVVVEGIACIKVTDASNEEATDKRLKTRASNRIVPIHRQILLVGFLDFVNSRIRAGAVKLFDGIPLDSNGFRSTAMSKWFIRFCAQAGASEERTSYHSLRHNFRDALREAQVPRDIAHALGGWASTAGVSIGVQKGPPLGVQKGPL